MPKHIRIRTKVGSNRVVNVNLNQDFDMLEILSLNMHQVDVYRRDCADFGVVCGRVIANGGFGVPNAKVSIFIGLDDVDNENEVIKQLYPYKSSSIRNEDGYVYNLLPQDASYNGHVPTGSFPKVSEVLLNQEVKYVYEKYYKFTAKTNESGDYMIYGVPPGSQRIVMNLDLSDMGCFSMVPEDFKLQGSPESAFDGARFKSDSDLSSLPQIAQEQKQLDVKPFWGDDEAGCDASITRMDFDLRDLGIEIKPTAVFMGSLGSDTNKDSVNKNCRPRWGQGELCYTEPQQGTIEGIRWTPFWKEEERPGDYVNRPGETDLVPVLERFNIDGGHNINEDGAFLVNVPMNLDYLVTNEFGEQVVSQDPEKGIPTKGKYRFRIKPSNTTGTSRLRRRGAYLVPNIREWNYNNGSGTYGKTPGQQYGQAPIGAGKEKYKSYAFSVKWFDYPEEAIENGNLITCEDYFYEFSFAKVYTVSQFFNFWKHRHRDGFIGIKEVLPRESERCERLPFPINNASRNVTFAIIFNQFVTRFLQILWQTIWIIMNILCLIVPVVMIIVTVILVIYEIIAFIVNAISWLLGGGPILPTPTYPEIFCEDLFPCVKLRVTKYPECQKCGCSENAMSCGIGDCTGPADDPDIYADGSMHNEDDDYMECNGPDDLQYDTNAGNTINYGADGCYLINFTSIIGTIISGGFQNFNVPMRWRRMEVTMRSLCDGLLNYFWANNWMNGFLYAFQFKGKLKPDDSYANGYRAKFCAEVMHFDPIMQEFYYRSCPTELRRGLGGQGDFLGDEDTALISNRKQGGFLGIGRLKGENDRNIHFPTTILDLGPVQEYIGEICNKEGYREGCSVGDDLEDTTFTNPGNILYNGLTERITQFGNWDWWSLGQIFRKEHKQVGGDIAAIFSQFQEVGVLEYEELDFAELSALGDPWGYLEGVPGIYFMGTPPGPPSLDLMEVNYAPAGYYTSPYGEYAHFGDCINDLVPCTGQNTNPCDDGNNQPSWDINITPPSAGSWGDYSLSSPSPALIALSPRILYPVDVPFPTVAQSPGSEVRDCIINRNSGSSQTVPYYPFWTDPNINGGTGFIGTQAQWNTGQGVAGMTSYGIQPMNYQHQLTSPFPTTPIYTNMEDNVRLGPGLHFYFGLIPGATAYDIFLEKYVPLPQDEVEEDEYFVI